MVHPLLPLLGCIVTWAWSLKQKYLQNRETANIGLDSSVGRAPVRQSGGPQVQVPPLVIFSLFIQIYLKMYPVSFPCGLLHDILYLFKVW